MALKLTRVWAQKGTFVLFHNYFKKRLESDSMYTVDVKAMDKGKIMLPEENTTMAMALVPCSVLYWVLVFFWECKQNCSHNNN